MYKVVNFVIQYLSETPFSKKYSIAEKLQIIKNGQTCPPAHNVKGTDKDNKRVEFNFKLPISGTMPIPGAARSKAWVYGRSLTGIVGSNPA